MYHALSKNVKIQYYSVTKSRHKKIIKHENKLKKTFKVYPFIDWRCLI